MLVAFGHMVFSWGLLALAGESKLTADAIDFVYYYVTTISTIGYGDLSPSTPIGKLLYSFFIVIGGLSLFGTILGKFVQSISEAMRLRLTGKHSMHNAYDHYLILGWGKRSEDLVKLIDHGRRNSDQILMLGDSSLDTNPMPDLLDEFLKTDDMATSHFLGRVGAKNAYKIVINTGCDVETMAICLALNALQPNGNVTAQFSSQEKANLISSNCPDFEILVDQDQELLAHASLEPGSGKIMRQMLDKRHGFTMLSTVLENDYESYAPLSEKLDASGARFMGVVRQGEEEADLSNLANSEFSKGDSIFYLAEERIESL
ncbi:potassium channel family protein [Neptuniibacter sp. QD37_11]|uniref:potassium channel protein n=1 Tax=Neptuniibacter sp. QD37_11 TaxID=3398209 RepID=UPI0039F5E89A